MSSGAAADNNGEGDAPGEATLLVSEFPPPPFYYMEAARLQPPEIPVEALERGTRKAAAAALRAREEAERLRLAEENATTDSIFGGVPQDAEEEEGDVVAVFGEIVEDPLLVEPLDACEDPTVIRDEVMRLNRTVVQGFVNMVQDLVHRPAENKKRRDEMTHNVFLMLQETNKFREHQSRELLIELLQRQLAQRKSLLVELEKDIERADALLEGTDAGEATPMDES
eukprot:Nitzschia sp. Nitz4//scaffold70_size99833//73254//74236//NITZ4_004604-RA/size99833-snap-gene-0.151-mRNA-1//-1//CDS//3329557162//4764//frame0